MKKIIGLSVFVIIVWLIYPIASNAETGLRIKGLFWDSKIDGKIKADKGSLTGTEIDLKETLGIKSSTVPEFEGKFNFLGMSRLIISYMSASYEGKTYANNISFAGITFTGNARLKTTLDISIGSLLYESLSLETPAPGMAPVEPDLGLLLGFKYFHIDSEITSLETGGATANKSLGVPIPVIGLRLQDSLLEKAQIELTYTLMNIKTSGINVSWSDLYVELKLDIVQNLPLGIGYKLTKVNLKNDNNPGFLSRFKFDGLYTFASFNF